MNKKIIFRMILLLGIGAVVGFILSKVLIGISQSESISILEDLGQFFIENNMILFFASFCLLFLPAVIIYRKGKKLYSTLDNLEEEIIDEVEAKASNTIDLALTMNGVFMVINFFIFGATFQAKSDTTLLFLLTFLVFTLLTTGLEVFAVSMIKKFDPRIKGDPTKFSFQKDFFNSCDEAEQLRIYKAGYHAFQTSRTASLFFIILTLLFHILFKTGAFPIFIACSVLLIQIISYGYNAIKLS